MARITRKQQKIFAESAANNGVFGSLQENNPTYSNDPDTIQGRPAYAQGWNGATYSSELLPPLEEFQALQYLFSRQIAYLLQDGVAEWNTTTPYYKGSIVKTISGANIKLFRSLADNNTGNQTTDTSKWALIYDSQNPYANSNFDNITDFSKNISNWSTNTTNCITEIPQDINLELSSGTLTLKAGSKVRVPNGAGTFNTVTITNDLTYTSSNNGKRLVFAGTTGTTSLQSNGIGLCVSGTTDSLSGTVYHTWYDTTNNVIKYYASSGTTVHSNRSFPICVVTVSNGAISSIDQVFNGFGYIGSTVFVLPDVKGLSPNGRNADGTLKNNEIVSSSVIVRTFTTYSALHDLSFTATGIGLNRNTYNEEENFVYNDSGQTVTDRVVFGKLEYESVSPYKVTSLDVKPVFHAVDYSDFKQADDENVKITGNQDIAGVKNFQNSVFTIQNYNVKSNFDSTVAPATYTELTIAELRDKNNVLNGSFRVGRETDGAIRAAIYAGNNGTNKAISISVDTNGNATTIVPTPSDTTSTSSTKIATTGWVNTVGNNVVHKSGDETIGGTKKFEQPPYAVNNTTGGRYYTKNTSLDLTASTRTSDVGMGIRGFDKNDNIAGEFATYHTTNGNSYAQMQIRNRASGSQVSSQIRIGVDQNGNIYTTAPTPTSATDHSTKIATTEWFRNAITSLLPTVRMTKKEDISSSGLPYTATADGIIRVKIGATYDWQLKINGTIVQEQDRNNSDSCVTTWICIPVKSGDVLTASGNTYHFDGGALYYPY